ncbi:MAG: L-fucose:H+ symporter permease, partial [Muribaculaceae bacterium]|nr:L-fucose:H+ symporter permease [Muribaculaceae bacterium]
HFLNACSMKKLASLPFILVALLFLMWGVANNMNDTILAAFKRIMSMSDLQTSLVQFAFYGAYFCFALPAALFIRRYSYKSGILLGLAMYAIGTMLFYPAGNTGSYGFFLFAIYVMASGCSILETTANPYILAMGKRETATRRLNIAQTFNPLGAILGIMLSRHFILSELNEADASARSDMSVDALHAIQAQELNAISGTYLHIGCILMVLLITILCVRMPHMRDESAQQSIASTFRALWHNIPYRMGVVAQFFYVGVQTCVWSFTIRVVMAENGSRESDAAIVFLWSIIAFTVFRFIFTWLMRYVRPVKLLTIACISALISVLAIIFGHGNVVVCSLVTTSASMSLMFPTIYGVALENIAPESSKIAASGLIMAILGGAVITPLQAWMSDAIGISLSFIIPLICFGIILIYSTYILKHTGIGIK